MERGLPPPRHRSDIVKEIVGGDDVVEEATKLLVGRLRAQTSKGRSASIALSGGRTPWAVLTRLAQADLDWDRVHVYQVDERIVPFGDPNRNLTHLDATLLSRVPAIVISSVPDMPDSGTLNGGVG